jgi:hypothetical protein
LRGFTLVGVIVEGLGGWASRLDAFGIGDTVLEDAHLGRFLKLANPDCVVREFHTQAQPSAAEA